MKKLNSPGSFSLEEWKKNLEDNGFTKLPSDPHERIYYRLAKESVIKKALKVSICFIVWYGVLLCIGLALAKTIQIDLIFIFGGTFFIAIIPFVLFIFPVFFKSRKT